MMMVMMIVVMGRVDFISQLRVSFNGTVRLTDWLTYIHVGCLVYVDQSRRRAGVLGPI